MVQSLTSWQAEAERQLRREAKHRREEIERELGKAKRRSLLRLVGRGLGALNTGKEQLVRAAFTPAGETFDLPIDQVVGVADEKTGHRRSLLLSGDVAARLWMRIYARDAEDYPALVVAETSEGWDLVGGTASLVQLEVLRAKGHGTVKAVRMAQENERLCECCESCEPETRATA